jgi:hypothetical protein
MPRVQYHHIGHDPRHGEIALWSVDDRGSLHENRRTFDGPDGAWLDWSHENAFREVKMRALGRVELDRHAGSIHISDERIGRSEAAICRLVGTLEARFPGTRWYLFGLDFRGESVCEVLARQQQKAA